MIPTSRRRFWADSRCRRIASGREAVGRGGIDRLGDPALPEGADEQIQRMGRSHGNGRFSELLEAGNHGRSAEHLLEPRLVVKSLNTVADGDRHFTKAGFEQIQDAALPAFLAAFFTAEFFEQGDVGHGVLLLKLLKPLSELHFMLCRQRHQPVDDEEQRSEIFLGVAPGVELLGEFQAAFRQVRGILAVLLSAEVGGDDEDRQRGASMRFLKSPTLQMAKRMRSPRLPKPPE